MFYDLNKSICETYPAINPLKLLNYPAEDVFDLIAGMIDYNDRHADDKANDNNNNTVIRREAGDLNDPPKMVHRSTVEIGQSAKEKNNARQTKRKLLQLDDLGLEEEKKAPAPAKKKSSREALMRFAK